MDNWMGGITVLPCMITACWVFDGYFESIMNGVTSMVMAKETGIRSLLFSALSGSSLVIINVYNGTRMMVVSITHKHIAEWDIRCKCISTRVPARNTIVMMIVTLL